MKEKTSSPRRSRIFLIEGAALARRSLSKLLSHEPDLEVCGEAGDVEEALKVIGRARADAAVVDVGSTQMRGPQAISALRWAFPALPLLTLSMREPAVHGRRMLQAGALAYIDQADAARLVVPALRRILDGGRRRKGPKARD